MFGMGSSVQGTTPAGPPVNSSGPILWLEADVGVTKDGANRVSAWADQSGNGYDVAALGALNTNKPVWTPAVANGLPMLDWGHTIPNDAPTAKSLQRNIVLADPPAIKTLGARSYFAVVKPSTSSDLSRVGGDVLSLDSAPGGPFIGQIMQVVGVQEGAYDGFGHYYQLNSVVDYTDTLIQIDWSWAGKADKDNIGCNVNGVNRPGIIQPGGTHFGTDDNVFRINIGYEDGAAYTGWTWSGFIGEILVYSGTNAALATLVRAYLKAKWGTP